MKTQSQIKAPLPLTYSEISDILLIDEQIKLPITEVKNIRQIASKLAKHYAFQQIPEEWIKSGQDNKTLLPKAEYINKVKEKVGKDIELPIKDFYKINETINKLKQYYSFRELPTTYMLIANAPVVEWALF